MRMEVARSWLFVPGHRQRMVDKAPGLGADVVIFDLEDGVPPGEKDAARAQVGAALKAGREGPRRFVRTHAAGEPGLEADLDAVVRPGLNGLVLPKVERPEDLLRVDAALEGREAGAGCETGRVRLLAIIESALGLVQAPAIASACPRLVGLMFGAEDFALDLGLPSAGPAGPLGYARSAIVVAAASARIRAVDRVYTDLRDMEGLAREAQEARELGFAGKALIHPGQIEPVHRAFMPGQEEVAHARRVVAAFEAADGEGTVAVDGRMVDLPVVERARRLLELYVQSGR